MGILEEDVVDLEEKAFNRIESLEEVEEARPWGGGKRGGKGRRAR